MNCLAFRANFSLSWLRIGPALCHAAIGLDRQMSVEHEFGSIRGLNEVFARHCNLQNAEKVCTNGGLR